MAFHFGRVKDFKNNFCLVRENPETSHPVSGELGRRLAEQQGDAWDRSPIR
jgi:hypothetical protein